MNQLNNFKFHRSEILEVGKNLPDVFFELLRNSKRVNLISPFITLNIAKKIIKNFNGSEGKVLTRFNLNDFRTGVSNLEALNLLHSAGFEIRGLKGLHAKTYIFDKEYVITTSANLTSGGFYANQEYGLLVKSRTSVSDAANHFQELWNHSVLYTPSKANEWKILLSKAKKSITHEPVSLEDLGGTFKQKIIDHQTFVKWLGTGKKRASLDTDIQEYVKETGSNFAICFKKRPRRYNENDQVFIAAMTKDHDYVIFGRALAYKHNDNRDIASSHEQGLVGWKKRWRYYIRLHNIQFIKSTFDDCPMLYRDVVYQLDYDSFLSTQKRHLGGESNIKAKSSLMQQSDVRLSNEGKLLLNNLFDDTIKKYGAIDDNYIKGLYNGNLLFNL